MHDLIDWIIYKYLKASNSKYNKYYLVFIRLFDDLNVFDSLIISPL